MRRQYKIAEKGKQYRLNVLETKISRLVSRVIRKSSKIDVLMYSYQNTRGVKEKLSQPNDVFNLLNDIHGV